jgi:hypothetical protein
MFGMIENPAPRSRSRCQWADEGGMRGIPQPLAPLSVDDDPWSLAPDQRRELGRRLAQQQRTWLPRLATLVEPPAPDDGFPAFLLGLPRFAALREAVSAAASRRDLDTATADELQRFVDCYRDYLTGG